MSDPFKGKTYEDWRAEVEAEDRARWEAAGTPGAFEEWRRQDMDRRKAELEESRQTEARAEAQARRVAALDKQIPTRYSNAETDHPQLLEWVAQLAKWSAQLRAARPNVRYIDGWYDEPKRDPLDPDVVTQLPGPSLLLLGPTGVGKTHHAFGALRRYVANGGSASIVLAAAADMYAALRPRSGVDSEDMFSRYAKAPVLFVDDLGAAKTSPWVEEINYRLVNYRYNNQLATLFTSNVPTKELGAYLGERVASRIVGMCSTVVLKGNDRRRAA